jgi:O-antigen ligase
MTLLLTFSRAGMVGGAIAGAVVVTIYGTGALRPLAPLAAGGFAGLLVDLGWDAAARVLPVLHTTVNPADYAGGVGHRLELWHAAWYFFARHPLLGIGAGNYELELSKAGLYGIRTHANSWYFEALADGGILLFAATLGLVTTIVLRLARLARQSPWTAAALAASIALAVHQTVDYLIFYPKVAEPWIALVALGVASAARF